jgi:hypothetical protein
VTVFAENGVNGFAVPENCPMTTGVPVTASARVAWIVAWPNEERLVPTTESPETTIVGPAALAGAAAAAAAINVTAAGATRRQIVRRRCARPG